MSRAPGHLDRERPWRPEIIPAAAPEAEARFLGAHLGGVRVALQDTLAEQVQELLAVDGLTRSGDSGWERQASERFGPDWRQKTGVWAYYPWLNLAVRLLDRAEFRRVRLSRNRDKLTGSELAELASRSVAVVGLSVGHSIALTLAMEGLVGRMMLADSDRLGLSNLNRVPAGVQHLGLSKEVIIARRIAEIDPFIEIDRLGCAVSTGDLDRILLAWGGVDLLIEETDDVALKRAIRMRARALGIPVLMETSARGLLDVERFDLEPGRPILHGHLEADCVGLGGVLRVIGPSHLTPRTAASMLAVGRTLVSWPQLASEIMLGAASVTTAARGVLLGRGVPSGRTSFDLEAHVGLTDAPDPSLVLRRIASRAVLAESRLNHQPWRVSVGVTELRLELDPVRAAGHPWASKIALGCAVFNARLAARAWGGQLQSTAVGGGVVLRWRADEARDSMARAQLGWLSRLQTQWRWGGGGCAAAIRGAGLAEAAEREGACLHLIEDHGALATRLLEAERARLGNRVAVEELLAAAKPSAQEGLPVEAIDAFYGSMDALRLAALPGVLDRLFCADGLCFSLPVLSQLTEGAGSLARLSVPVSPDPDSLAGGLGEASATFSVGFQLGVALQAVWLAAAEAGLGLQPLWDAPADSPDPRRSSLLVRLTARPGPEEPPRRRPYSSAVPLSRGRGSPE